VAHVCHDMPGSLVENSNSKDGSTPSPSGLHASNVPGEQTMRFKACATACLFAIAISLIVVVPRCSAQQTGIADNGSDTWVATDALGRKVDYQTDPKPDRKIAMFYFLWLGPEAHGGGPWDVSRILAIDPSAIHDGSNPLWGPVGAAHHWGEPLFGFYNSHDPWVLRKHAQMLADAGVDVVIFDTSNKATYPESYLALMEAFSAERAAGNRTPDIAFLTPFWDPASTVAQLWKDIYSKGLHKELWFMMDGKPFILADPAKVDPALKDFFTFRNPQPSYFEGPTAPNMWSWLEVAPQHVFRNVSGEKEEMSVGVAQNAVDGKLGVMSHPRSLGRSYHDGKWETAPGAELQGLNFKEQWENVLKQDPKFVFVTGWNEWIAGRFEEFAGFKAPVIFVDEFDQEHSRDIEPMKGGHGDNYYYQFVEYARKYKGSRRPPEAGAEKSIDLAKGFEQWDSVTPEYRDEAGDTFVRDYPGYNTGTRLTNRTGRNDLIEMKVARDSKNLYFYARTREKITPYSDPHWMTLFIDADRNHATGWEGYDFLINHSVKDDHTSILERTSNGWNWEPVREVQYRVEGDKMMIEVPRAALGLANEPIEFEFKWADNWQQDDNIDEFTVNGDAAPPGRFNYLYTARPQAPKAANIAGTTSR